MYTTTHKTQKLLQCCSIRFVLMSVMSDMCGKWKLESRDENFESFLTCRGVGWFLRKMMTTPANVHQEYKLSQDNKTFTRIISSMGWSTSYDMPTEGEYCPTKTLSGKPEVGRLFETSDGNLILEMRYVDTGNVAEIVRHRVEDNKLLLEMQCEDIIAKEVYTKCDS